MVPAPLGPPVAPLEPLAPPGFFCALLEPPEVPPAPDGLELPVAELPPLDDPPPCWSHAARSPPLNANAIAAANAVDFMFTSMGLGARNGSK